MHTLLGEGFSSDLANTGSRFAQAGRPPPPAGLKRPSGVGHSESLPQGICVRPSPLGCARRQSQSAGKELARSTKHWRGQRTPDVNGSSCPPTSAGQVPFSLQHCPDRQHWPPHPPGAAGGSDAQVVQGPPVPFALCPAAEAKLD